MGFSKGYLFGTFVRLILLFLSLQFCIWIQELLTKDFIYAVSYSASEVTSGVNKHHDNIRYQHACARKNHVVLIKAHKTGSTTLANMLWKVSLRRGVHMLTFDVLAPFIHETILPYILNEHPSLHKVTRIEMAAEHMVFNENEISRVMPRDSVYISSLRDPVSQLISTLNFFQIPQETFNITAKDPVREFIMNIEKYIPYKEEWDHTYYNTPNAYILGLGRQHFNNNNKVEEFIKKTDRRFHHMVIQEHYDESLIVLRRKLYWEISDILYLTLREGNYSKKPTDPHIRAKVQTLLRVDFILHQTFNKTLWRDISRYGPDFWEELRFYTQQKWRIRTFCQTVIKSIRFGPDQVEAALRLETRLVIPESPWGREYTVDYTWCLVSKLNMRVFRNLIRIREYPELCDNLMEGSQDAPLTYFYKNKTSAEVDMNPAFCRHDNASRNNVTFNIPLEVLLATDLYNT